MTVDYDEFVRMAKKGLVSKYDIEDMYNQMIASEISKETGTSISYDRYDFIFNSNGHRLSSRDADSYDDVLSWVETQTQSSGGKDTVKLVNHYKYDLNKDIFLGSKMGEFKYTYAFSSPIGYVCDILSYALDDVDFSHNNYVYEDMAKQYAKKHPEDENTSVFEAGYGWTTRYGIWIDIGKTVDPMFEGFYVKFFKNGKVQVKGLSTKEWEKIEYLFDLVKNAR